jgi:DNA-directed RNA polymerase beta' subunit
MSNLARAGIFGETDDASGIAASVTIGKTIPSGTGGMDILVDIEKLSAGVKASTILEDDEYT